MNREIVGVLTNIISENKNYQNSNIILRTNENLSWLVVP